MAPTAASDSSNRAVCVMDASGHLGTSLTERESQLGGISFDKKKLKVFNLDPFDYRSILDALKGRSGLFYSFEPPQDQPDYDEHMTEVEVRAAHNVLEACARTETIDKVVFTSSANRKSTTLDLDLDERHWTDVNFCHNVSSYGRYLCFNNIINICMYVCMYV
ncbi:tetraketide alpha-pyrone reductase 1-like [Pyrus ussuriensis x Pyrus communis]|uniref:Tetraketide alpha-pyrone reductase 1-like n=1 Tax=Pyrus ussuriensis x Pyrus communis TaxID=2448454 RepID=A0A5N5HKM2_9ROSA|nr:tetraketide alpha-pyrone reductase 1-like [Pyrus ussuriensis x Pyrus communis]